MLTDDAIVQERHTEVLEVKGFHIWNLFSNIVCMYVCSHKERIGDKPRLVKCLNLKHLENLSEGYTGIHTIFEIILDVQKSCKV